MGKSKIIKSLSLIVILSGAIVMIGWILEIEALISINPNWVTMKLITALSFFLSGIILYFIVCKIEGGESVLDQIILTISTILILFFMLNLLMSSFFNFSTGIEHLFVDELNDAVKTTIPGRPSIGTMINFIMVSIAGILSLFEVKNISHKIYLIGIMILIVGCVAVLGYIASVPLLYYTITGYSTAMALHTAILFILIGIGFINCREIRIEKKLKMNLHKRFTGTKIFLIFVLVLLLGLIALFLFSNKNSKISSLKLNPVLSNHPIYSSYNFLKNDSIINIGIQPMYLPTGIILEVIKRDKILNETLASFGKQINYYPFFKGADVNFFIKQKMIDGGVGGDMPALSIASDFEVVIPMILQKGNVSIVSNKPMLSDDLVGKRIAYPYGSISHYFLLELMQSAGITEPMVDLVPMEVSSMALALHNKEIDLFTAWEPIVESAIKQYPDFQVTYKQITTGYLYFSEVYVNEYPTIVNHILAAVIRSISWLKSNNDNLRLACGWNLETIEDLTGKGNILNVEEMLSLAKEDLIGYHSKYSIVIKDKNLKTNSSLYNEYEFLRALEKDSMDYNWKKVKKSFDNNMVNEILEHPDIFRLNEYDYILKK